MRELSLFLDGFPVPGVPEARIRDGEVLIPLYSFVEAVGAEAKTLEDDALAVCRGDICIRLKPDGSEVSLVRNTQYVALSAFGEALGLRWKVDGDAVEVTTMSGNGGVGLGIGARPPGFTLPDLDTDNPVSPADYRGRKAVFYVWASW